jgi:hypothetical protein
VDNIEEGDRIWIMRKPIGMIECVSHFSTLKNETFQAISYHRFVVDLYLCSLTCSLICAED